MGGDTFDSVKFLGGDDVMQDFLEQVVGFVEDEHLFAYYLGVFNPDLHLRITSCIKSNIRRWHSNIRKQDLVAFFFILFIEF